MIEVKTFTDEVRELDGLLQRVRTTGDELQFGISDRRPAFRWNMGDVQPTGYDTTRLDGAYAVRHLVTLPPSATEHINLPAETPCIVVNYPDTYRHYGLAIEPEQLVAIGAMLRNDFRYNPYR